MQATLRVEVISERPLIRAGLVALLNTQPNIEVVNTHGSASLADVAQVALLDTGHIPASSVPRGTLVIVARPEDGPPWLQAGASGAILDSASVEELLGALRQIARGDTYLPAVILKILVTSGSSGRPPEEPIDSLTQRENEVLRLLGQGLTNKAIAQRLYLSVRTVEGHLANVYGKLHLKSRTEAAIWTLEHARASDTGEEIKGAD